MAKNWLRNLIFEDPEEEKKDVSTPEPARTVSTPPTVTNIPLQEEIDPSTIFGKVDQNLLNKLCAVLDAQNKEGIDYLKFKKSVDSLRDFQPDESARFTTAFITLKATHPDFSKEAILKTIDEYIRLMEQERSVGLEQLNELRKKGVDQKEKEIIDAAKRVETLKDEINKLSTFIAETNGEIIQRRNDYALQEANFNVTVNKIVDQLKGDRNKIETIIK